MRKYLIYIGIALCLGLSANKVYQTFFADKPLAAAGECLEIQDPQLGRIELKIVRNDDKTGFSEGVATIEVGPGMKIKAGVRAKYSELKDLDAKKVECSQ